MTLRRAAPLAFACVSLAAACTPFGEATASGSSQDGPASQPFSSPAPPHTDGGGAAGGDALDICGAAPTRCGGQLRIFRFDTPKQPPGVYVAGFSGEVWPEDDGYCAPLAMHTETTPTEKDAYFVVPFNGKVTEVHVRFAARGPGFGQPSTQAEPRSVQFGCGVLLSNATDTGLLRFEITSTGALQLDGEVRDTKTWQIVDDPADVELPSPQALNAWHVGELSARVDSASGKIRGEGAFDGTSVGGLELGGVSTPTGGEVRCGVLASDGSPYIVVDIDDVQVELCGTGLTTP